MELTNQIIFNLNEIVNEINVPAPLKFNYMLDKNKGKFRSIVKTLPRFEVPKDKVYEEFLKVTEEKIKTEKITFKNSSEVSEYYQKELESNPAAKALREKAVEEHKVKVTEWEKTKVNVDIHLISIQDLPDGLTQEQYSDFKNFFTFEGVEEREAFEKELKAEKAKKKKE